MNTVFVTGASGFIGAHLTSELNRRGVHLKCLVRPSSKVDHLPGEGCELYRGEINQPESYRQALEGCDAVINLAGLTHARRKESLFDVNAAGCRQLANACRGITNPPKIVHVSSLAAAGPARGEKSIRDESEPPNPISDYGRSKRAGEVELQKFADEIPITIIRPGVVFGPADIHSAALFRAIYRLRLHVVIGFRTPPLSLIHVDDLVRLILDSIAKGETLRFDPDADYAPHGYYLACDDSEHPNYWQFGQRIGRVLNRRVIVWPLWRWVGRTVAFCAQTYHHARGKPAFLCVDKVREATAPSWASSAAKARNQLGFQPIAPLQNRLRETADWFLEQGWL